MKKICAMLHVTDIEGFNRLFFADFLFKPLIRRIVENAVASGAEDVLVSSPESMIEPIRNVLDGFLNLTVVPSGVTVGKAAEFIDSHRGDSCLVYESPFLSSTQLVSVMLTLKTGGGAVSAFDTKTGSALGFHVISGGMMDSAFREGCMVIGVPFYVGDDAPGVLINSVRALHAAAADARLGVAGEHMDNGVFFTDASSAYIEPGVVIGEGSVILPNVMISGKTVIGSRCVIGPGSVLRDASIGNGVTVNASHVLESSVADGTSIGPFTHVRPGSDIGVDVKIGDFVEVKNSKVGDRTSISHLTYVGDSVVGKGVNFGCGVVTVNYDGMKKHVTEIGDDAFIGCNTNLIAPVKIGNSAYTAAGSTITKNVPDGALAVSRVREQIIKANWTDGKIKKK